MEATYQFSYDKLWHKLIDLKLKKKDLQKQANLSPSVIAKMGRGESVNLETLAKICLVLH
ncbi:MAG: helix-turn-helix domain-containing protein, partial [Monoglobaceae bacterium]